MSQTENFMADIPSGTVTFLFTDIEGSTKLAQAHPDRWESLREKHHAMLKEAIESKRGHIFQIIGDSFCAAFHTASDAVRAEETVQEAMKVLHEVGEMSAEIGALDVAGRVALAQGDLPKAQKHFREGISRLKDSKEVSQLPSLLEGLANALATQFCCWARQRRCANKPIRRGCNSKRRSMTRFCLHSGKRRAGIFSPCGKTVARCQRNRRLNWL